MAYLPGWRATALNVTTGKSEALTVTRDGLIQDVTVPGGSWRVHFHYHAPYIELESGVVRRGRRLDRWRWCVPAHRRTATTRG